MGAVAPRRRHPRRAAPPYPRASKRHRAWMHGRCGAVRARVTRSFRRPRHPNAPSLRRARCPAAHGRAAPQSARDPSVGTPATPLPFVARLPMRRHDRSRVTAAVKERARCQCQGAVGRAPCLDTRYWKGDTIKPSACSPRCRPFMGDELTIAFVAKRSSRAGNPARSRRRQSDRAVRAVPSVGSDRPRQARCPRGAGVGRFVEQMPSETPEQVSWLQHPRACRKGNPSPGHTSPG